MISDREVPSIRILSRHHRAIGEFPRIRIGSSISCEREIDYTARASSDTGIGIHFSSEGFSLSEDFWR